METAIATGVKGNLVCMKENVSPSIIVEQLTLLHLLGDADLFQRLTVLTEELLIAVPQGKLYDVNILKRRISQVTLSLSTACPLLL
jgi:hypothetical protein